MPANPSTSEMGRRHVERAAEVLGAVPSAASGSKWQNPADGRSPHDGPYPVAIEGKSTRGKSLAITLDMIAKLREQSLGENPVLPMCWYGTDDLSEVTEDWAAVPLDFLGEILASARAWVKLEATLGSMSRDDVEGLILKAQTADSLQGRLARAQESLTRAGTSLLNLEAAIDDRDRELAALRVSREVPGADALAVPPEAVAHLPRLPWTIITAAGQQPGMIGEAAGTLADYDARGVGHVNGFREVRIERSPDNRPMIFADGVRYRNADVYGANGQRKARACEADPSIEEG